MKKTLLKENSKDGAGCYWRQVWKYRGLFKKYIYILILTSFIYGSGRPSDMGRYRGDLNLGEIGYVFGDDWNDTLSVTNDESTIEGENNN